MVYEIGRTKSGLRMGFTTGSCAAAAAKAATYMLLSGETIQQVKLMTPKGIELYLDVEKIRRTEKFAECAIRKYSGDDPDVTNGLLVFARVKKEKGTAVEDVLKKSGLPNSLSLTSAKDKQVLALSYQVTDGLVSLTFERDQTGQYRLTKKG